MSFCSVANYLSRSVSSIYWTTPTVIGFSYCESKCLCMLTSFSTNSLCSLFILCLVFVLPNSKWRLNAWKQIPCWWKNQLKYTTIKWKWAHSDRSDELFYFSKYNSTEIVLIIEEKYVRLSYEWNTSSTYEVHSIKWFDFFKFLDAVKLLLYLRFRNSKLKN